MRLLIHVVALTALALGRLVSVGADDTWDAPPRVVAVGDVHGDLDQLVTVLKAAALVDEKLRWKGGRTHLVQTGDRIDRGPDSRKVMDLFIRLEKEAKKAGGMVHALTGNHEVMNMLGDLRYVIPEEFAAFQAPDSVRVRDGVWEQVVHSRKEAGQPAPTAEDRRRFDAEHPLGWVEHRRAYSPRGTYGGWIAKANAVDPGGRLPLPARRHRAQVCGLQPARPERAHPEGASGARPPTALVSSDPEGPLWFRGLAREDPALLPHLEAVLARHGARRMVIGHTPTEGLVMPLYGGRVVLIDVGLSKAYGGPPAALVLERGRAFALHRGKTLPLPEGEGEAVLAYVREVAALEPDRARLAPLLGRLGASP